MYIPKFNEEQDVATLHALINAQPLGTWAAMCRGEITVNHIPFLLHAHRGGYGTLVGHVARANPVWQECAANANSVVVFQGPQAYVSPSWYPSKKEHGKVVPTWNYAVVHAHGVPRPIDDARWLLNHVDELSRVHEADQPLPWQVADAPKEFIDKLLAGIVGIEITITRLEGKWKLGQNRPLADRLGLVEGLRAGSNPSAAALAQITEERLALEPRDNRAVSDSQ